MRKGNKRSPAPGGGARASRRVKRSLLIFHINDSTDDQVLFQTACKHAKLPFAWHVADSVEKALSYLQALVKVNRQHSAAWPDLVLLDIVLGADSGLRVLEYMQATAGLKTLPVVILTSQDDPTVIREAQKLGADSYLLKPKQFHETVQLVNSLYSVFSRFTRGRLAKRRARGNPKLERQNAH